MGSPAWRDRKMWLLLESEKYRAGEWFVIERGEQRFEGTVEFGHVGRRMVVYVGDPTAPRHDGVVTFDEKTRIDGVPAKEWHPELPSPTESLWVCHGCEMIGPEDAAVRHMEDTMHPIVKLEDDVAAAVRRLWGAAFPPREEMLLDPGALMFLAAARRAGD